MLVYFGGEDTVTKLIAKRIIQHIMTPDDVIFVDINPRDYGTRALEKIVLACRLSDSAPVVFVFDSDCCCVVDLLKKYAPEGWTKPHLAINVAIDEGEAWLMADRAGFAKYFGIALSKIPILRDDTSEISSSVRYKTSLFFLQELAPTSRKSKVRDSFKCVQPCKKPPTYNNLWPEFINNIWNIDEAAKNSESLFRTIQRIKKALLG
jgi:hypothetical protein